MLETRGYLPVLFPKIRNSDQTTRIHSQPLSPHHHLLIAADLRHFPKLTHSLPLLTERSQQMLLLPLQNTPQLPVINLRTDSGLHDRTVAELLLSQYLILSVLNSRKAHFLVEANRAIIGMRGNNANLPYLRQSCIKWHVLLR